MDPIITTALTTFASGFAGAALGKATGPGQVLDDLMVLAGFDKLHVAAEKRRVENELNIQQYKESIAQKVVAIPEENLQDPSLAVVGPAIEASKFYIEEEDMREMFANLIAASMDKTNDENIHPAFVEIIKQITPLDAANLRSVYYGNQVIGRVLMHKLSGGFTISLDNLYVNKNVDCRQESMAASIDNLVRLNLVEVTYDRYSLEENAYEEIYQSIEYKNAEALGKSFKNAQQNGANYDNVPPEQVDFVKAQIMDFDRVELVEGKIVPTMFGSHFCQICLSE